MPTAPFSRTIDATFPPPVMEARRWIAGRSFPAERPLLNLSQAAPVERPPLALREEIARAALEDPQAHLYGPVLGLPELRAEIATQWSAAYGGSIAAQDVCITSGCNEAFCAAISTIAAPGEAVMLPTPWYFNHKMWLDTAGIEAVPLPCGPDMVPDPQMARALISAKVKAIVLVTPNNPTGAEYPAGVLAAFLKLAQEAGITLVVDETYRDFHSASGAPHALFTDPRWRENLVHLYSFSKVFRLTGHRVGAMVASPERLAQVEKFLDSMTICPAQLGQMAALHGLRTLKDWVAGERREILARRAAVEEGFAALPGWKLLGCGAYFAYAEHPFPESSLALAEALVEEQSLLLLPGTMFTPEGAGGERQFRIAFANADVAGLGEMIRRLAAFTAARTPAPAS
ncbi:aminotransferase [Oceanicella sp. SM1341]|uniref:aminotransferase n=1 Tax=Oceanicella sp. SM1341 TaxID=1548889 RepID=UPI000E4F3408|nr:aminotransferase [Oceanicella sp. SM1341]